MNGARFLREAGMVQRTHTVPFHGSYSVGQHVYNMLTLLYQTYPGPPPPDLVKAVLYHDAAERITGDVPRPAKDANPELRAQLQQSENQVFEEHGLRVELDYYDNFWLKGLDLLEFYLFCHDQLALGNQNVRDKARVTEELLDGILPGPLQEFFEAFKERGWTRGPDE